MGNSLKGEYMLKRRNMKKMLGIGSLCLFLLGCSEESFLVQKDSSSIILEEESAVSEELQLLPMDVGEQSVEIIDQGKEEITEQKLVENIVVTEEAQNVAEIAVHICGAVKQPGVYYLKENQRLYEGIQKAGGFREDAEENYLNQALVLEDGMQIIVPTKEEVSLEEKLNTESQKRTDIDIEDVSDSYTKYFANDVAFENYLSNTRRNALYQTNVEVDESSTIVSLSTCTNVSPDERLLVQGVKINEKMAGE